VVREALALVLQALIDAEATQHIGARPMSAASSAPRTATGPAPGCYPPRPVMSSCASQAAGGLVLPGAAGTTPPLDRALLAVVMEA